MEAIQNHPATASTSPQNGSATGKKAALTSDYEMFLKMLTTQMTNQDPLNPVDSSDYAVQLATFSSVEQQVLTNDLLAELTAQISASGLSDLAGYVGREVRTKSPAYFDGAPIDIMPDIPEGAQTAKLAIRNAAGDIVQHFDLDPNGGDVAWAGVDTSGNTFPTGTYSFEVTSFAGKDVLTTEPASVYARIVEAQTSESGLSLILSGGLAVSPDDVTAMRE